MITTLEIKTKRKNSNYLEADLKSYIVDKNQITENPKRIWFKGSRYR
tara:strand:- start:128 stop:268 length:141 start_codon:yes stop_codon:yes gene_type:complete